MSGWDGVHLQCNYRHLLYVYNFFVLIKSGVSLLERGGEEVLTPPCSIQNTTLSKVKMWWGKKIFSRMNREISLKRFDVCDAVKERNNAMGRRDDMHSSNPFGTTIQTYPTLPFRGIWRDVGMRTWPQRQCRTPLYPVLL